MPSIGKPAAKGLLAIARLQPGERVLHVACGTGVVTRAAASTVGLTGRVASLDINVDMRPPGIDVHSDLERQPALRFIGMPFAANRIRYAVVET